jgi:mannose-6-phosphate isomerase-like protein (cupin superfamily)
MEAIWFLDTLVRVHAGGEDTDGRYGLVESVAPAGHQPPPHVHHREDEGFYVLDGELTVYTGDADGVVVGPGQFLNAPRGVPHTFRVTSDEPARWLVSCAPAGFEAFVREFGEPATADELPVLDGPPEVERLVRVAAGHGIEILGPPGMLPAQLTAQAA